MVNRGEDFINTSSTRIRGVLNPQLFLSRFKHFPVLTYLMESGFTLEKLGLHLVPPYCFIFSVRDWTRFCYVIGSKVFGVIGFVAIYFFHPTRERIQKYPDSLPNSPDACGRKPYPERKSCGFKNIRIRVD